MTDEQENTVPPAVFVQAGLASATGGVPPLAEPAEDSAAEEEG